MTVTGDSSLTIAMQPVERWYRCKALRIIIEDSQLLALAVFIVMWLVPLFCDFFLDRMP